MILHAVHHTRYEYPFPAQDSHNELRLMPLTLAGQKCLEFSLEVTPHAPVFSYEDFGGTVHHFGIRERHMSLDIVANAIIEMTDINPIAGLNLINPDWDFYALERTRQNFAEYLGGSPYVHIIRQAADLASNLRSAGQSVATFLIDLNRFLYRFLEYDPGVTNVHTTLEEVFELRAGVCQDYAHLMIACCRSQGIPTRYVSGYLYGGKGIRGEQGTHAWVECLMPDGRWLALDPTNNLLANDHHIRMHVGRDFGEVSPTRGVYVGPMANLLHVGVSVVEVTPSVVS